MALALSFSVESLADCAFTRACISCPVAPVSHFDVYMWHLLSIGFVPVKIRELIWTSEMLIARLEGTTACQYTEVGGLCTGNVIWDCCDCHFARGVALLLRYSPYRLEDMFLMSSHRRSAFVAADSRVE